MDPGTLMMIASLASSAIGGLTGSQGGQGSTYNQGQLGQLEQILNDLKGMKGGADITQNQNYMAGQDWLQSLFNDPAFFDKFEGPIKRQYEEEIIPDLANRFSAQGSGGSLGSTAFRNQLAREGSNLSTNLAALRGGLQSQGVNQALQYGQAPAQNYLQLLQQALQPTQNTYTPPSGGFFGNLAGPLAAGAASYWGGSNGGLKTNTSLGTSSASIGAGG